MTTPVQVVLPDDVRRGLLDHARRSPDVECCGLLIGAGERTIHIEAYEAAQNIAPDRAKRFEIDPKIQFDVLRRLHGTPRRIVGHYHSHPGGPAAPSAHDLAMAHDPEAIWLIVAPTSGEMAAFISPDHSQGFVPLPILARL
jgi:proteasome lid subunit RPN8/RPN11